MDAKLHDYSEGAVTAGWYDGNTLVMEATFVYGSPYIFFEVFQASHRSRLGQMQPQVSAVSGMKVETALVSGLQSPEAEIISLLSVTQEPPLVTRKCSGHHHCAE